MKKQENECIVLIPYYKNELTEYEKYSLNKVLRILSGHPISLFSPADLTISEEYRHINVCRFENKYFQALGSYNQLLLSELFYERFLTFKYILIYQLDCLVFKDELHYWCSLDYDYYGAPWNRVWRRRYYNFFGLVTRKVGNGGFSLRKTAVFYEMAKKIRRLKRFVRFGEDIFWSNYGSFVYPDFKIIDENMAIKFAFESEAKRLFQINAERLPFGCHAFVKNDLQFWKERFPDLP